MSVFYDTNYMMADPPPYSELRDERCPISPGKSKQQTIYVQGPPIIIQIFRDTPVRIQCQYCQAEVFTATHHENGAVTWLACLGIMLVLPLGCCLIPFFIDGTKDVVHTCPNCYQEVGKWSRL
ncbi:LITAF domain-containing protein-like isoform X2 [Dreissena polymorpha]|uniref:LITAF domain-containing protein-like isoform X2 n=1 Tax=Dreissena polymorpha TaxID=45954 RepID=UPI00226472BF|nr:LITAF domain-containing protein-like isoform X2 [Dreissena polymorpha]